MGLVEGGGAERSQRMRRGGLSSRDTPFTPAHKQKTDHPRHWLAGSNKRTQSEHNEQQEKGRKRMHQRVTRSAPVVGHIDSSLASPRPPLARNPKTNTQPS